MQTVKSEKSVSFPKLNWGISAGEIRELPECFNEKGERDEKATKAAHERILEEPGIELVKEKNKGSNK